MTREEALQMLMDAVENPANLDDAFNTLRDDPSEAHNARIQELENNLAEAQANYRKRWGESNAGATNNNAFAGLKQGAEATTPTVTDYRNLNMFSADTE